MATLRRVLRTPVEASLPLFGVGAMIFPLDTKRMLVSDGYQYRGMRDYLVFTEDQAYTPTPANGQSLAFELIYLIAPTANRIIDLTAGTFNPGCQVVVSNLSSSYNLILTTPSATSKYVVPGETYRLTYTGSGWVSDSDAVQPGTVSIWPASTAPVGSLICNGADNLSRTIYGRLYGAIGTTWGSGDGSTTFGIPDQAEAAFVGVGTRASGVADHDTYSLAEFKDDQFELHWHDAYRNTTGTGVGVGGAAQNSNSPFSKANADLGVQDPRTDGVHSLRSGSVTRGKRLGVNFIIKF